MPNLPYQTENAKNIQQKSPPNQQNSPNSELTKTKNKKLQKLNWQKNHSKIGKKTKLKEKKHTRINKIPNNLSNNLDNSSLQNPQSSQNLQPKKPFPSFYQNQPRPANLSKFQNNLQNIAQNLSFQIEKIPTKINQNLPNFEQNSVLNKNNSVENINPKSQDNPTFDQKDNSHIDLQNNFNAKFNTNNNRNFNANSNFNSNLSAFSQELLDSKQTSSKEFINSKFINPNSNNPNLIITKPNFAPKHNSSNPNFIPFDNYKAIQKSFKNKSTTISRQFAVRHTYRAGAIVWVKYRGENYYVVFRSLTRPSRGVQLPGGRIERMENVADAVTREVYEEIGIQTRILCPLGFLFTENPTDNFSRIEIYYIVRPVFPIDVFRHWQHQDLDEKRQAVEKRQTLECWCVPCSRPVDFLSFEQGKAVEMFKDWLSEHKKPDLEQRSNF